MMVEISLGFLLGILLGLLSMLVSGYLGSPFRF